MIEPIDLVVPYVDNRDPNWIKLYRQYVNSSLGYGSNEERFRSYDLFKYFFRAVEKNMSFINHIFLIVQSKSQVPEWLDTNKVIVIEHADFIPTEYLPVFNSCTIEMFLSNILPLSERFIYANDDCYAINNMIEQDFFIDNTPVFGYKIDSFHDSWKADYIRYNVHKLITNKDDKQLERIQHVFIPYLKSTINKVYKEYNKEVLSSITRVRDGRNLSQWLFAVYQIYKLKHVNRFLSHVKTKLLSSKAKYFYSTYKAVCLNDCNRTTIEDAIVIENTLDKIFPHKSRYEK